MTGRERMRATLDERLEDSIRQHADVVRGHDAVHLDRNDCGGVGGCRLMRAEHDAEVDVIGVLKTCARLGDGS